MSVNKLLGNVSEKPPMDTLLNSGVNTLREELAKTIAAEAASEGWDGMLGVGNVINNRSKFWKKDPLTVISQKNQFYGYTAKNRDKLYSQVKETADKIADMILSGEIKDNTGGATYFRQPDEKIMSWHGPQTIVIKNHIFHADKPRGKR